MKSLVLLLLLGNTFLINQVSNAQDQIKDIDVEELKTLITEGKDLIFLDVRTPEEISAGKIKDALEINYHDTNFEQQLSELDKDKTYVVYCKAGGRSANAKATMEEMGFMRIYNLLGGYNSWNAKTSQKQ